VNQDQLASSNVEHGSRRSQRLFRCVVALVAGMLIATVAFGMKFWQSPGQQPSPSPDPAQNLAKEANDYLREKEAEPLSGALQSLLTDPANKLSRPSLTHFSISLPRRLV
jgi:hypothetical protein